MNTVSSIHPLWQGLHGMPLGATHAADKATSSIPAADLAKLNTAQPARATGAIPVAESNFSSILGNMIKEVNAKQVAAGQAMRDLQSGQQVSLHQAMIAAEEANVSFQLMVEVRNKLLESYQELMRMQV